MRQFIFASALAAALASCTSSGTTTTTISAVQSAAVAACNFLPDASTIANILTANPIAATAESIAGIICSAITGQPASGVLRRATAPKVVVNGQSIPVTGHFVAALGGRAP